MRFKHSKINSKPKWFEDVIADVRPKDIERFGKFFEEVIIYTENLNKNPNSDYFLWGKLMELCNEEDVQKLGYRFIIVIDVRNTDSRRRRRTILHELRHIEQTMMGLDISEANFAHGSQYKEYKESDLEQDAIAHEQISRWFE